MSSTFPRVRRGRGYDIDEVEDFLDDARRAYTGDPAASQAVTSESIRRAGFTMRRGGYSPSHVDAALERLEDAFANRERERALAELGDNGVYQRAREEAQVILDRCVRPRGRRFTRVGPFTPGYSVRAVDELADRVARYLRLGEPLAVDEVRGAVFPTQRGGYAETQVDVVLDAVIDVLQAVAAPTGR